MAWETTPIPQPKMGHTGQKYHPPPPNPTASQMPSMSEVGGEVDAHAETCGPGLGGTPARVIVPQTAEGKIGDEGVEFVGVVRAEGPAQPVFVLRHRQVALGQCKSEVTRGPFPFVVPGADIGHDALLKSSQ